MDSEIFNQINKIMSTRKSLITFTDWLLRIAVLIFIFSFYFTFIQQVKFEIPFWTGFFEIALSALFLGIIIIILSLDHSNFELFGFFLVFIGSAYKILYILFTHGLHNDLAMYFMLLSVAFYFMSKPLRTKRKSGVIF